MCLYINIFALKTTHFYTSIPYSSKMSKKRISAYISTPSVLWLDRQISKGFIASYSHGLNLGLKLLKKSLHTTIKFKIPNEVKNVENEKI